MTNPTSEEPTAGAASAGQIDRAQESVHREWLAPGLGGDQPATTATKPAGPIAIANRCSGRD